MPFWFWGIEMWLGRCSQSLKSCNHRKFEAPDLINRLEINRATASVCIERPDRPRLSRRSVFAPKQSPLSIPAVYKFDAWRSTFRFDYYYYYFLIPSFNRAMYVKQVCGIHRRKKPPKPRQKGKACTLRGFFIHPVYTPTVVRYIFDQRGLFRRPRKPQ